MHMKTAVISGADRNIGLELARQFLQRGWRVFAGRYLMELPLKIVESCGSVNHPSFKRYLSDKTIKKHNWFLNRDNNLVYFFFNKNNVKHLVVLEPSDEMLEMIKSRNYLNFGVWQN